MPARCGALCEGAGGDGRRVGRRWRAREPPEAVLGQAEHGELLGNPAEVLQLRAQLCEKLGHHVDAREAYAAQGSPPDRKGVPIWVWFLLWLCVVLPVMYAATRRYGQFKATAGANLFEKPL